jgi:hypothetical protein
MMRLSETKRRLEEARQAGADRLHGYPLSRSVPKPELYVLQALDRDGRVYVQRALQWPAYVEAVKYWQQLGTPNQTMLAEEVA